MLESGEDLARGELSPAGQFEVARREAQIEALLEAVPDALFAVDADWRITLMNTPAEDFFRRRREALIGCSFWEAFPEALGTKNEALLREAMHGSEHGSLEIESVTRPGRFVQLRMTRKATGGLALLFSDITEQRNARARERAQSEEFRALADNIPALCWMTYADGHVYWFNSRWYDFTGTQPETQLGWGWASVHEPEILPDVKSRWEASLTTGEPFEMVFSLRRRDGVFLPFLVRAVPVRDAAGTITRWFGSCTEIGDQIRQQQRLRTMVGELNHRVKNTLATVQSLASNSLRRAPDVETGYRAFESRLMTLSAAHNILTQEKWDGADLSTLLASTLAPYWTDAGRVTLGGPEVRLSPSAALDVSLITNELATNATKYGALSRDGGSVDLTWALTRAESETRLRLVWTERGGPPAARPTRTGFGTRLIKRVAQDEGGVAEFDFTPVGLDCTVTLPVREQGAPFELGGDMNVVLRELDDQLVRGGGRPAQGTAHSG